MGIGGRRMGKGRGQRQKNGWNEMAKFSQAVESWIHSQACPLSCVLVFCGCCNKLSWLQWLKQYSFLAYVSGCQKPEMVLAETKGWRQGTLLLEALGGVCFLAFSSYQGCPLSSWPLPESSKPATEGSILKLSLQFCFLLLRSLVIILGLPG